MATLLGPWDVQYPVNFYENGDTVTQAFEKHIEEIVRIYGLLNALDAGKVTVEDFNAAMAAERQARIDADNAEAAARANADTAIWNKINGLTFGDIKGSLGTDRINGLADAIKNSGGGVTDSSTGQNGYIKFANGMMLQWGRTPEVTDGGGPFDTSFPMPFPNSCMAVASSLCIPEEHWSINANIFIQIFEIRKNGFKYFFQSAEFAQGSHFYVSYIAIGN